MVVVETKGNCDIGDDSDTLRLTGGQRNRSNCYLRHACPSIACPPTRRQSPASRKNAKHAIRPSDVAIFHETAGQVVGGDVAPTFGARQRAVGEGSPERDERAKPRWFGAVGRRIGP